MLGYKFTITYKHSLSDPISTFVSRNKKKNTPENTAFLTPVIASRKRGRHFKPEAPSRITLKERKGPNKLELSDDEITQLINLWKQEEALYNSKCDSYSNCDEKDKVLERIITNLAKEGIEATKTQITEKLTSLRSYYSGQRGKERASKSSGSGTFDVFVSSWKFMKDLSFLEDNYVPRKTESNLVKSQNHANGSTEGPKQHKINHAELLEKTSAVIDFAYERFSRSPPKQLQKSADDLFGEMVSSMLKELTNQQAKDLAKLEINRILVKAKCNGLNITL